ncbi:hypothetical protein ABF81_06945 [Enterobacter hormaechei subsp. steigerwaltii]|uniref:hypothetical protein n=1 Tax=Enterobacter hormaechei TaxID=158836 RepID=UPI00064A07CB|nr:hypothetical protein [Enterobacter hormaechei]KLP80747.1 hypothetical protein ABF81_06945 [Enterobacter hormaechei subsp. steigerwaltii]
MASAARKKITLIEMHAALIALGHEKLWWRAPVPKGRKQGVCQIVTWDDYVVARNDLDVYTKGWDVTDKAAVVFPRPPGSEPSHFDDELDNDALLHYCTLYG